MTRKRRPTAFRPRKPAGDADAGGAEDTDFGVPIPGEILPEDQWARTAWKKLPPPGPLVWAEVFGREAPVILDIGCGNGRFTITSALARPECDFLAIDILPLVLRYATRRANQRGLRQVRFAAIGGHDLLEQYVPPGSLAEIHLYHPQPYRDEDRRELRLLTPEFLALVHSRLKPDGLFVVQTDNRGYQQYLRTIIPPFFHFEELNSPWPDAPAGRTRREIYARAHKLTVYRSVSRPRCELTPTELAQLVQSLPRPNFRA